MTKISKIHLTLISLINLTLILEMINTTWEGNDKAIILVILSYPILTIINGLIWLTLKKFKSPYFKVYKISTIGLAILFIPTLIASSLY